MEKLITTKQYMENPTELHQAYFLQFATHRTESYVLSSLKVDDIKKAIECGDIYLNEINIPYNNMGYGGGWWWDNAPINLSLLKEAGGSNSPSTRTCVAKAVAKELAK